MGMYVRKLEGHRLDGRHKLHGSVAILPKVRRYVIGLPYLYKHTL
jgi:hypothetical protein